MHLDSHRQKICRRSQIAANDRHDLRIASRKSYRNQKGSADPLVRGVECDPSCPWQVDLCPSVRRASIRQVHVGVEEIARSGTGSEAKMASDLDKERGDVSAGTARQ